MPNYIYALLCPKGEIRYIGKTNSPLKRLNQHVSAARSRAAKHHCANWIRSILRDGLLPTMEVLYQVPEGEDWKTHEINMIAFFKELGFSLTNIGEGGEGTFDMSPEAIKERVRKALITKASAEYKEKIKDSYARPWRNPDIRASRLAAMAEARLKPGHYEKRVAAGKDVGSRPEVLKKRSEKMKKHYPGSALDTMRFSDHFVRRRAEGQKMRWAKEEEKEKVRQALLDPRRQALMQSAAKAPEAKAKRAAKMASIQSDPDYLANQSAKTKANWENPDFRAKMAARQQALYERTHTPEHLAMMRDKRNERKRQKRASEDPAVREQRLAERRAVRKLKALSQSAT